MIKFPPKISIFLLVYLKFHVHPFIYFIKHVSMRFFLSKVLNTFYITSMYWQIAYIYPFKLIYFFCIIIPKWLIMVNVLYYKVSIYPPVTIFFKILVFVNFIRYIYSRFFSYFSDRTIFNCFIKLICTLGYRPFRLSFTSYKKHLCII